MIWWVVLLLVGVAVMLALWMVRNNRRPPVRSRSSGFAASTRPAATRPMVSRNAGTTASGVSTQPIRPARPRTEDTGPETVLSYLHFQNSAPVSDYPSEIGSDFGPSSLPPESPDRQRLERALRDLQDGPADKAWETLKGFRPEPAHQAACLETLERIALAFERDQRFDAARDVYEHMADIDPHWRDVKLRLMRARGLAQNATVNTWGTVPAQPMPQVTKRQLGKYLVDKEIGRGAMGAVYLGYDPATDHRVALKTMALAQEFSGSDLVDARARFLREAEMAGRLEYPDIVSIIDAGEENGLAFIAMELVEGTDLSDYTSPDRLLPLAHLIPIMARVAAALAYAHTRGVTHRDIKPGNIMVDLNRDVVKVMDFGVARVADAARTRTGVVLGTPTFMSPEQLAGQNIDGRSDLYSLGVTFFQLLTGQLPYRNDSMAVLMRAIAQDPVPHVSDIRPEVPRALGDVVALALQKHPNTRYADGQQMAEDLRAVAIAMQADAQAAAQAAPQGQSVDLDLG
ncbi:MAG: serine/threonine-protein kinase [Pseudomonadota bacterium]